MSAADIVIIIVVIFFIVKGFMNGLIKETAGIAAVLLGLFVAVNFTCWLSDFILKRDWFDPKYIEVICFAILFFGVLILVIYLSKLLDKFANKIKIQWLNKIAGLVFGFIKGLFIVAGLCYLIELSIDNFSITEQKFFEDSKLYAQLLGMFKAIFL